MESFESMKTNQLKALEESNDIAFLKNELAKTERSLPECAAESLFRTNKISILKNRINTLQRKR